MATRCAVLFTERGYEPSMKDNVIYFYRHWDGYIDGGAGDDLEDFVRGYKDKKYRCNIGQSAGWLIVRGYLEEELARAERREKYPDTYSTDLNCGDTWKVGAYEPSWCINGWIEYLYNIDLSERKLYMYEVLSEHDANDLATKTFPPTKTPTKIGGKRTFTQPDNSGAVVCKLLKVVDFKPEEVEASAT